MKNVLGLTLPQTLEQYDIIVTQDDAVKNMCSALARRAFVLHRHSRRIAADTLDDDRSNGCIRRWNTLSSKDGGLAVLYGNFAENGFRIVKTAGVDDSILKFTGPAKVYESQDDAVAILGGKVVAGDVVVIRYEGPKGGPGMAWKCSTQPVS